MRRVLDEQMKLGEVNIAAITFDLRSRDEIPQLLAGLQHIYTHADLREKVFGILRAALLAGRSASTGRPGMDLWCILVLGTLRVVCGWDFDKLKEMADNHLKIRELLGHSPFVDKRSYALQTLRDNVSLMTPELLAKINAVVVAAGHALVRKAPGDGDALKGRCDSFVVETTVHFPTDINLLFDAMRKVIILTARLCASLGLAGWRQSRHNLDNIRSLCYAIGKMKHSTAKDEARQARRTEQIAAAYRAYLEMARDFLDRADASLREALLSAPAKLAEIDAVSNYVLHARRQIDQVQRRVLNGETIPHDEKVFSIFEQHTEWISKGKAGVPQELGLRVCILEDQYGFLLHHAVMQGQIDQEVAVTMVTAARTAFPELSECSFDKGFYTPQTRADLTAVLDFLAMPKKGKLSEADRQLEYSLKFRRARARHSAVESAINALENHGLDRCPDRGIAGFRRYVALAVVARNLQQLGRIVLARKRQQQKRAVRAGTPAQALPHAA